MTTVSKPATHAGLVAALAAFQENLPKIGKANTASVKSDRGSYSYKYADLAEINAAVLPELAKNGLSWTTKPTFDESGRFVLVYKLAHVSGEFEEGTYPLGNLGLAQAMGSAITYARRYCICAVTGVAPDEDDDGAAATQYAREISSPPDPEAVERQELLEKIKIAAAVARVLPARVAEMFASEHEGRRIKTGTAAELRAVLVDLETPEAAGSPAPEQLPEAPTGGGA